MCFNAQKSLYFLLVASHTGFKSLAILHILSAGSIGLFLRFMNLKCVFAKCLEGLDTLTLVGAFIHVPSLCVLSVLSGEYVHLHRLVGAFTYALSTKIWYAGPCMFRKFFFLNKLPYLL